MVKRLYHFIHRIRLRHILLLAMGLRLAWYLLILLTHPQGSWLYDSNEYWNIAYNLDEYGVFSRNAEPPLQPDYFRTPLYPFFIYPTVWFDPAGKSIPFWQILADLVSCFLLYKIALRLTANTVYAKAATLVYALHFPALVMTSFVLSESILLLLITWFTWSLLQCLDHFTIRRALVLGLAAGLCVMCKPVTFILVFPTLLFLFWQKKWRWSTVVMGLCFTTMFYAVQFPWMYRNKQVHGHYFNSLLGEHLVFGYHACHVYAQAHQVDYFEVKDMLLEKYFRTIDFNPYAEPYKYAKLIERESYKILWENRWIFAREHIKECVKFFVQPLRGYTAYQLGETPYTRPVVMFTLVWQVVEQAFLYLSILYYLVLVLRKKRKVHPFVFFILFLLVLFCQFNTMPYTDARMRFPFDGLIITAATYAVFAIRRPAPAPGEVQPILVH